MELTKYEWPAIKYLKSQDVKFMKGGSHEIGGCHNSVATDFKSSGMEHHINQWVVSNALKDHKALIFRPKQPKQIPDLNLHGSPSGQQMYR